METDQETKVKCANCDKLPAGNSGLCDLCYEELYLPQVEDSAGWDAKLEEDSEVWEAELKMD